MEDRNIQHSDTYVKDIQTPMSKKAAHFKNITIKQVALSANQILITQLLHVTLHSIQFKKKECV